MVSNLPILLAVVLASGVAPRSVAPPAHSEAALHRALAYIDAKYAMRGSDDRPRRAVLMAALAKTDRPAQLSRSLYGEKGAAVLARLEGLGPGFDRLLVHPGLVLRLDRFERFVRAQQLEGNPDAALARFKQSLGERTVYRALALTEKELKTVLARGLESDFARNGHDVDLVLPMPEEMSGPRPTGVSRAFAAPLAKLIDTRLLGWGDPVNEPLISVGQAPRVAAAAARPFAKRKGSQIYLFKLRIPEIDIFYTVPHSVIPPLREGRRFALTDKHGTVEKPYPSRALESFLLFKVDPQEIVEHSVVEVASIPTYEFKAKARPVPAPTASTSAANGPPL